MIARRARRRKRAAKRAAPVRGTRRSPSSLAFGAALGVACVVLGGCGRSASPSAPAASATSRTEGTAAPRRATSAPKVEAAPSTIRVLAAASFTDVLANVEEKYERTHPSASVELAFGGSQELRMQLENGAEADLFVSANASHVEALEREGRAIDRRALPCNHLVVVTPRGNPLRIGSIRDLARARRIVLGVETSPIGRYTSETLAKLADRDGPAARDAILAHVVSRELDVRQALAKVRLGEADASIVYATDALSAGEAVATVAIDPELDVVTRAFVARVTPTPHPAETARFLDYLSSPEVVRSFRDAGFVDCP